MMSRSYSSLFLVGLLSAFSLLTFDLYQPSLSFITQHFATTSNLSQLTLSIYLLFFGVTQLIWGPLIDHYGRRRLLPGSLILAAFASVLCAFAPNIYVLIFGRSLQGVALCCANLIALSTSRDFEDSVERAKILSYISMIISGSPILAPVVGSLIFTYFGWQANFILMAAIAVILLLQAQKGLRESPYWQPTTHSFSLRKVTGTYQELSKNSTLWYGSLIMMFSFAAVMFSVINSSYLIIDQLGFSALGYGIIFIFNGLNIIVGNYLGIALRKYLAMTTTIYIGSSLIVLGGVAMLFCNSYYGFTLLALSFALVSNLGISVCAPPTMSITLTDFKENTGLAIAIINTVRLLGSSLLSILVGYLLLKNLNALPLGLIATGLATWFCAYQFNSSTQEDTDLEPAGAL